MVGSRCVCGFLIDFDRGYGFSWENSDGFINYLGFVFGAWSDRIYIGSFCAFGQVS